METIEQLQATITRASDTRVQLGCRDIEIDNAIREITGQVGRGDPSRASEVQPLLAEQAALQRQVAALGGDIEKAQSEIARRKERQRQAELHMLFERMEQKRQRIIELSREVALLLGELQSEDRTQGESLVPLGVGSLDQQNFLRLLQPVDIYCDRVWAGGVRDVAGLDFAHVLRIRPVTKL
jgi:hypothetical protein